MGDSRVNSHFSSAEPVDTIQPDDEDWHDLLSALHADNQSGSAVLNLSGSMRASMDFTAYDLDDDHADSRVGGLAYTAEHSTPSYRAQGQALLSPALSTCAANMLDIGGSAPALTMGDDPTLLSASMQPSASMQRGSLRTWSASPHSQPAHPQQQVMWGGLTTPHEHQWFTHDQRTQPVGEDVDFDLDISPVEPSEPSEPCYAQLLYNCLKAAPEHTLSLREIYEWVSQHTQKAQDPTSEGWKNSVRHNLSMNKGFEKVERVTPSGSSKKSSLWRLSSKALEKGHVISTTRFRKKAKRKPDPHSSPAVKRQISGAKGGLATRRALRQSRQQAAHAEQSAASASTGQQHSAPQRRQDTGLFSPQSNPFSHAPSPHVAGMVSMGLATTGPYYHQTTMEGSATHIPTREPLYASPFLPDAAFNFESELGAYDFQHQGPAFGDAFRRHADTAWDGAALTEEGLLAALSRRASDDEAYDFSGS